MSLYIRGLVISIGVFSGAYIIYKSFDSKVVINNGVDSRGFKINCLYINNPTNVKIWHRGVEYLKLKKHEIDTHHNHFYNGEEDDISIALIKDTKKFLEDCKECKALTTVTYTNLLGFNKSVSKEWW